MLPNTSFEGEKLTGDLFIVLESVLTSSTYDEDDETTLDHNETDGCEEDFDDSCHDPDYEEQPVFESFSLSYMKRAIVYYDAINPKAGQRALTSRNVQSKFKRISYQSYMTRFRRYVEEGGTKKQKVDSLNDYVYNNFERVRDLLCPVHDMDLKRWAVRQARFMSFYDFVTSDTWLLNLNISAIFVPEKL